MSNFAMADSRMFTNYESSCIRDEQIKQLNGIKTDEEYRVFLHKNGLALMEQNNKYGFQCKCYNCVINKNKPMRIKK